MTKKDCNELLLIWKQSAEIIKTKHRFGYTIRALKNHKAIETVERLAEEKTWTTHRSHKIFDYTLIEKILVTEDSRKLSVEHICIYVYRLSLAPLPVATENL